MITLEGEALDNIIEDLEDSITVSNSPVVKEKLLPIYRLFIEKKIVGDRVIDIPNIGIKIPLLEARSYKKRYDTEKIRILKELRTKYDLTLKDAKDVLDYLVAYPFDTKEEE